MKLHILRNQAGRFLGGINFELSVQVELTSAEAELVRKYQAGGVQLLAKKMPWGGGTFSITINSLVSGEKFKGASITEIIDYEDAVREGCKVFKTYLEVMRSFGGTETIEYELVDGEVIENRLP